VGNALPTASESISNDCLELRNSGVKMARLLSRENRAPLFDTVTVPSFQLLTSRVFIAWRGRVNVAG